METNSSSPEFAKPRRKISDYLNVYLTGFIMGSADVVPGVSGGTVAFVLGSYEELIGSIRMIGQPVVWRSFLRLQWRETLRLVNFFFLAALGMGLLSAIFLLAPGIEWMLTHQPVLIWSFFFGLVAASILVVAPRVKIWSISRWVALLLGTFFGFWLVGLVPVQTPDVWWFYILSGAIAICAMILPGISGSFVLVLLGKYQDAIIAVNERDFVTLALIACGALVGLVTFSQILSWLFRRYHDLTVAALTGLMIGSMRKVWPWKEVLETMVDRRGEVVPLVERNLLPPLNVGGAFNMEIVVALAAAMLGVAIVVVVERIAMARSK